MTDASELPIPELDTLEPLTETAPVAPVAAVRVGAPPPFYRSDAHSEYYHFLFAGLVMALGCMMPFSADWNSAGYKTLGGAIYLILALGLVWSMWTTIYGGRFRMKWIMLALIPFLVCLLDFIYVDKNVGIKAFKDGPIALDWVDTLKGAFSRTEEGTTKAANFCRAFGTGRIVLFLGALLNFVTLLTAVFGGAKHAKTQKVARTAGSERRR